MKLGALLLESVRIYFSRFPDFGVILLIPGSAAAILFVGAAVLILGVAPQGEGMDPTTVAGSLTRQQMTGVLAAVLVISVVLSFGMAATVHAASGERRVGVRLAFRQISSKAMQLFWLLAVISVLALQYSPWALPVMWVSLAFGIPVALREDLGPSDAMDRAWELSAGNRWKVLVLEMLLWVPLAAAVWAVSELLLKPHVSFDLNLLAPAVRVLVAVPVTLVLLVPVQFMYVVLARGYEMLKPAEAPVLHARAASNVSSS
jgi:hypothetical protein